jgi:hypothetical protein
VQKFRAERHNTLSALDLRHVSGDFLPPPKYESVFLHIAHITHFSTPRRQLVETLSSAAQLKRRDVRNVEDDVDSGPPRRRSQGSSERDFRSVRSAWPAG